MNKKILASVMAVTLVFAAAGAVIPGTDVFGAPVTASAATLDGGKFNETIEWSYDDDGTLTISGTGEINSNTRDYPWMKYCGEAKKLVVQEGITYIGYGAFENFSYLESAKLPESLTYIGLSSFQYCATLKEVNFPSKLETIDLLAFALTSIESVNIPASVKTIGVQAFHNTPSLRTITVAEDNPYFTAEDDVLFDKNKTRLITYASKKPDTVYDVPDTVKTIDMTAFDVCSDLTAVNIGADLEDIGCYVTYFSYKLTDINVSSDNPVYKSENGIVFSKDGKKIVAYPVGKADKTYAVPNGITDIGIGAFSSAKLTSVDIPDSVETIELGAFYECSGLESLTIPKGVKEIGVNAFCGCRGLTEVTVPENVQKIASGAFASCDALRSITIENKDCELEDSASTLPYTYNGCVIKGHSGSTTEDYCTKYGRNFVSLDKPAYTKGDVNLDGNINVTDIAVTASHIKGIKALTGDGLKAADVNADGSINVTDIAMIASHIKGIKALS